jgi:hypothetical protein
MPERRAASWIAEVIDSLGQKSAPRSAEETLAEGLSGVADLDDLRDLLGATSILLHASAMQGDLVLPQLGRAFELLDTLRGPDTETAVIGVGDAGRAVLKLLSAKEARGLVPMGFYIDVESSRSRDAGAKTTHVILESAGEGDSTGVPRYGDHVRAAYRAAAGSNRPPPLLADNLRASAESKITAHVVAGLEDPWTSVLPDLLLDLRSFLGRGTRGRTILHLLTRPSPRVRGTFFDSIAELERSRPFDEAFVLCASEEALPRKVMELIDLTVRAPELLLHHAASGRGGAFASYGVAHAPALPEADAPAERYLRELDDAYHQAAPTWVPGNAVLLELVAETVSYVYPPDAAPPEEAWRLLPSLNPVAVSDGDAMICRIQRGLRLSDLRLR